MEYQSIGYLIQEKLARCICWQPYLFEEHTILYKDISFESEHEIRFESKFNFIPWLQIKLASVQLAKKYMERVTSELDALQGTEKEPNREFLLLQGVRFAFRVHQV